MTRTQAKNQINDCLRIVTSGLHRDEYWLPVNASWKNLRALGYDVEITSATYRKDSNGCPDAKTWMFEIDLGTKKPLYGILTAHGAGTTEDPLCKYDISAYVS